MLRWSPSPGINCLIGRGDSGKSTILEAIDLCLGISRVRRLSDSDFYQSDPSSKIQIAITIGNLPSRLLDIEWFTDFLRGYNESNSAVEDEPSSTLETVLTVKLTVGAELDPIWRLYSERSTDNDFTRDLPRDLRQLVAPIRLDASADRHLRWGRGSVLLRLVPDMQEAKLALVEITRAARGQFGSNVDETAEHALQSVLETADSLGVPVGDTVRILLDADAISIDGGSLALHDSSGTPLSKLGNGSKRILSAGLIRKSRGSSGIAIVDEVEHGLEPHRIVRFLHSLGSKDPGGALQVFGSTHSPITIQELDATQLYIVRPGNKCHTIKRVCEVATAQGTVRHSPHALLAPSILVCEGGSEVGLIRGLDQYFTNLRDQISAFAHGLALVDAEGGGRVHKRAQPLLDLGYRVAILRDSDVQVDENEEAAFASSDGTTFEWSNSQSLEDALFLSLSDSAVRKLIFCAAEFVGESTVDNQLRSISSNQMMLDSFHDQNQPLEIGIEDRTRLGKLARSDKHPWFKTISRMETVSREIVGPDLTSCQPNFSEQINDIFEWAAASPD